MPDYLVGDKPTLAQPERRHSAAVFKIIRMAAQVKLGCVNDRSGSRISLPENAIGLRIACGCSMQLPWCPIAGEQES